MLKTAESRERDRPAVVTLGRSSGITARCHGMAMEIERSWAYRAAVLTAAMWLTAVTVAAHLKLLKSQPADKAVVSASPRSLQIWFSEAPLLPLSGVLLRGRGSIKTGPVRAGADKSLVVDVLEALGAGRYEMTWKAAGDDGHVLRGTLTFEVTGGEHAR